MNVEKIGKQLLNICLFVLISASVNAQGIKFFHGTWEQALEESRVTNKPLFVDVFTSWCGPCKRLSKKVFVQKSVGDYFNENFICFKLQADAKNDQNKELAKKLNVSAYPTLLWLNHKGEMLHTATGYKEARELIIEGKTSFDTENRLGTVLTKWKKGDRSFELGKKFFAYDNNKSGEFDSFFMSLNKTQKMDSTLFDIIFYRFPLEIEGEAFKYMLQHRIEYCKKLDKSSFDWFVKSKLEKELESTKGTEEFEKVLGRFKAYDLPYLDMLKEKVICLNYFEKEEYEKFGVVAQKVLKKYGKKNPYLYATFIYRIVFGKNKEVLATTNNKELILKWAKEYEYMAVDKYESSNVYVQVYRFVENKEKALEAAHNAIDALKSNPKFKAYRDMMIEGLQEEIESIKKMVSN